MNDQFAAAQALARHYENNMLLDRVEKLEAEVKRLRGAIAQATADIRKADQESVMRRDYDAAVDAVVKRLVIVLAERGEA